MKLIVILLLFTGLFAEHNVNHIHKELSHLKLSEKQTEKVKKILQNFREELKLFRMYKEEIEEKKKKLFTKNSFSLKDLNDLHDEICKRKNRLEANLLRDIHIVLNEKQRFEFIQYFEEWKIK